MIQTINQQTSLYTIPYGTMNTHNPGTGNNNETDISHNTMDTVNLTQNPETVTTYSNSISTVDAAEQGYDMLRRLVANMLKEQGIDYVIATVDSDTIDISQISQQQAQELVAEDGYFGVEQTSDRIVNFALAISGGDVTKLDAIKKGVEDGFNQALEAFGGALPDISYQTFDVAMEKLESWAAEAQSKEA